MPFVITRMNLEGIMLCEIYQTEKRQILYVLTYVESKIVELIETQSRLMVTRGWVLGDMGSTGTNFQL